MSKRKSKIVLNDKKNDEITTRSKRNTQVDNQKKANKSKNKKNKKQKGQQAQDIDAEEHINSEDHSEEQQAPDIDSEDHSEEEQHTEKKVDGKKPVGEGKDSASVSLDAPRSTMKKIFLLIIKILLLLLLIYTVYTFVTLLFVSLFKALPTKAQNYIKGICNPYINKVKNATAPATARIQSVLNWIVNKTPWVFVKGKYDKFDLWYMEKLNKQASVVKAKKGVYVFVAEVLKTMNLRSAMRGYDNIIRALANATKWCLVSIFELYWSMVKYFVELGYY